MNRYVKEGIARDLVAGKRIAFVHLAVANCAALHDLHALPGVTKVVRANGRERIEHESGGVVTFHAGSRGALRGMSCDVVYLGHPKMQMDSDTISDAFVATAASGGDVIRGD